MASRSGRQGSAARASEAPTGGGFWSLAITLLVLGLIFGLVRALLIQPFSIPSPSMLPTLLVGDYVVVSKASYGYSRYSLPYSLDLFSGRIFGSLPQRGDVAVFRNRNNDQVDYIKRVIGLPGERIQMVNGVLTINGTPVKRTPAGVYRATNAFGQIIDAPLYTETLPGGFSHVILEKDGDNGDADNTEVFEVPAGEYFMMGDNRDDSADSRFASLGTAPFENFIGKAQTVVFSISGDTNPLTDGPPGEIRYNRLFTRIR